MGIDLNKLYDRQYLDNTCADGHKIFKSLRRGSLGVYNDYLEKDFISPCHNSISYINGEYLCIKETKGTQRDVNLFSKSSNNPLFTTKGNIRVHYQDANYVVSTPAGEEIIIDNLMRTILDIENATVTMTSRINNYANPNVAKTRLKTTLTYDNDVPDRVFTSEELNNLHKTIENVLIICDTNKDSEPQENVLYELLSSGVDINYVELVLNRRNTELQSSELEDENIQNKVSQVKTALEQITFIKELEDAQSMEEIELCGV